MPDILIKNVPNGFTELYKIIHSRIYCMRGRSSATRSVRVVVIIATTRSHNHYLQFTSAQPKFKCNLSPDHKTPTGNHVPKLAAVEIKVCARLGQGDKSGGSRTIGIFPGNSPKILAPHQDWTSRRSILQTFTVSLNLVNEHLNGQSSMLCHNAINTYIHTRWSRE